MTLNRGITAMVSAGAAFCLFLFAGLSCAEDPAKKTFTAAIDADGIQRAQVSGGDFFFDPNHIIVKVNVPVELSVRKTSGIAPHDIAMDSPEAGMKFSTGFGREAKIISFTPTKTGSFPFSCTKRFLFFKSHKDRGMEGVIEVVE